MILRGDCIEQMRELDEASIDAVVCDPPYGIGFMGHQWDQPGEYGPVKKNGRAGGANGGQWSRPRRTGPADRGSVVAGSYDLSLTANRRYQAWCEAWAQEALRLLKPGGHLLASCGTRTYHRLASGVEDAGFEVRDSLVWIHGSGFPKSLDVSKAIDKRDAGEKRLERARTFQAWLRPHLTPQRINELTGTDMGHHLTTHPTQPAVATGQLFDKLRPELPKVPEEIEALVRERTVESENFKRREKIDKREMVDTSLVRLGFAGDRYNDETGATRSVDITAAHTPEAAQWEGWGTALKPAHDPIVVARKPLSGTVAANVLEHGTGALNVDGCRIANTEGDREASEKAMSGDRMWRRSGITGAATFDAGCAGEPAMNPDGRWPANVTLSPEAAEELDRQSGELTSGTAVGGLHRRSNKDANCYGHFKGERTEGDVTYGDTGGASRFFYVAKASRAERNAGLDGFEERESGKMEDDAYEWAVDGKGNARAAKTRAANVHPTVKPIDLMRWLVRLVTPPGGTVCDPFLGSGTTGCAAVLEGFGFIGIEREAEYAEIAEARIEWWSQFPVGTDTDAALGVEAVDRKQRESGQESLL